MRKPFFSSLLEVRKVYRVLADAKAAALAEERKWKSLLCVSLEPRRRTLGAVTVLPVQQFFELLWTGRLR